MIIIIFGFDFRQGGGVVCSWISYFNSHDGGKGMTLDSRKRVCLASVGTLFLGGL